VYQYFFLSLSNLFFVTGNLFSQQLPVFEKVDSLKGVPYEIMCPKLGPLYCVTTSAGIIVRFDPHDLKGKRDFVFMNENNQFTQRMYPHSPNISRAYEIEDSIRAMAIDPDGLLIFAANDNTVFFLNKEFHGERHSLMRPVINEGSHFTCFYFDNKGNTFIGTDRDNFYWSEDRSRYILLNTWKPGRDSFPAKLLDFSASFVEKSVPKKIIIAPETGVFAFAQDSTDKNIIWVGTNHGLFSFNNVTHEIKRVIPKIFNASTLTITHIETDRNGDLWFSTQELGMGYYSPKKNAMLLFQYIKKNITAKTHYPITTFCYKSEYEFYTAVADSSPAIFNKKTYEYTFINAPSLSQSPNTTSDIKVDRNGNLYFIKGGVLYIYHDDPSKLVNLTGGSSTADRLFITNIETFPEKEKLYSFYESRSPIQFLKLKYAQNSIIIQFDQNSLSDPTKIRFAWKLDDVNSGWIETPYSNQDSANLIILTSIRPGKHLLKIRVKEGNDDWRKEEASLIIIVSSPFWQTWWFWTLVVVGLGVIVGLLLWWRTKVVKRRERERFAHEKQLLELEALALRAQMNPHFIFNCLNSIKSLMQEKENEKGINYLTTFSKLIRTLFNNADKKDISLFDEIETCKYYLQLEAMRFDAKLSFLVNVDENRALKALQVSALIIKRFIENAIWHGIVPRGSGGNVSVNVIRKEGAIEISIDDDGIGREVSAKNKSASNLVHQSKGVNLTQSRLELNNLLQQRQAVLEVVDKKDQNGIANGTTVIIKIKEET